MFPPEIVYEMDAAEHRANREIISSALYTSIKAVINMMYELNERIKAGVVLGVWVTILNMSPMPNTNVLEPPPVTNHEFCSPCHVHNQPFLMNSY